jgi:predicted Zn finger-like uncharacterized protein
MYSQCPECLTRFRVTAGTLRAAHGTVRCGRCGSAFDALQRLTDTVPDDAEPRSSSSMLGSSIAAFDAPGRSAPDAAGEPGDAGGDAGAGAGAEFHFSADDIEQVFIDARDWQKRFPRAAAERATADTAVASEPSTRDADQRRHSALGQGVQDDFDASMIPAAGAPVVFVHEPEAIEDITLEGERIVIEGLPELDDELREVVDDSGASPVDGAPAPDDGVKVAELPPPAADPDPTDRFEVLRGARAVEPAPDAGEPIVPGAAETGVQSPPPIRPFRLRPSAAALEDGANEVLERHTDHLDRGGATVAWGFGALLLAIVLVAQLTHHFREDLARDTNLGPVVRDLYARLGRPLAPNWDLAAFEVRQWGAGDAAPAGDGAMIVRASLRNGAAFAQPLPLLRLELEDRFGDTVARRDFEPAEYLDDSAQASRLLAPGAQAGAALDVVAAGPDAVGYRLDVCLRDEIGAVRCAQSPRDDASVPR